MTETNPYCHKGMACHEGCGCADDDGICRCGMLTDTKCYCNGECAAKPESQAKATKK